MPDIDRRPASGDRFHDVHNHVCPNCNRPHMCNCVANRDRVSLVCTDCEMGRYDPRIHGGTGEKEEA